MRFVLAASVLSLTGFVAAQSIPACLTQCFATGIPTSGCGATDLTCLCNNQAFIASTTQCLSTSCDAADLQAAATYAQQICAAQGVTLGGSTSGSAAASSSTTSAAESSSTTSSAAESSSTTTTTTSSAAAAATTTTTTAAAATTTASGTAAPAATTSKASSGAGLVAKGGLLGAVVAVAALAL